MQPHESKRKYFFERMKIGASKKFDYKNHGRIRYAVYSANKRGEGHYICRIKVSRFGTKNVYVWRTQ